MFVICSIYVRRVYTQCWAVKIRIIMCVIVGYNTSTCIITNVVCN